MFKKKDSDKGEHLIEVGGKTGNLSRDSTHPDKGYRYMAGYCLESEIKITKGNFEKRRKILNEFNHVHAAYDAEVARLIEANFKFPKSGGPAANFCRQASSGKKAANQRFPYKWQSHHIIPDEIFNTKNDPIFNEDEKKILKELGYNINHGHNIIFLPGNGAIDYVPAHGLIQHIGSHPNYTKHVEETVEACASSIKSTLSKLKKTKDKEKHKVLKDGVLQKLHDTEHDLWGDIVSASRKAVKRKLENKNQNNATYVTNRQDWFKLG